MLQNHIPPLQPDDCEKTPDPHLSEQWFDLLTRTALPRGTSTSRIEVESAKGRLSALPVMRLPTSHWRLEALQTFYSPIYGPVNDELPTAKSLTQAFHTLRINNADAPAVIDLSPLCAQSPFIEIAVEALQSAGWLVDRYFRFGNWYTPIETHSFETFLSARPSRLQNTLARTRKKVAKTGAVFTLVTNDDSKLERAVGDFIAVYNKSWKRPEPFPEFIPGLCKLAASRGWLRLGLIHLENHPVAAQIWLVAGGRAQIVKLAHDGEWQHGSIGTLMTAELMRHVIEKDRVWEIDYLIGDDSYKKDWTPLRRERHGLIAFNPRTPRGLFEASKHFGGRFLKRLRPKK